MSNQFPRIQLFGSSITRLCTLRAAEVGAINLSQGYPEGDPPQIAIASACDAIANGNNQYADMRGHKLLREAIARNVGARRGMQWIDPDLNVSVTCGATEAMAVSLLAVAGPGDEVVVQVPSYENYRPQVLLTGASVKYLVTNPPDWRIESEALKACFSPKTKAIIINQPNNPTGRVFSAEELTLVAAYASRYGSWVLSDEIYEHFVWKPHIQKGFQETTGWNKTISISGVSKTFAATGWRVGWCIAPTEITAALRRVHDFVTATVPTPLQIASATALGVPASYYDSLNADYQARRDILAEGLSEIGLDFFMPEGAYYLFPSCKALGYDDSVKFADDLMQHGGVAVVPHTAFYPTEGADNSRFRINFAKKPETLRAALHRFKIFATSMMR